jgi:hypothetical protein
LLGAIRLHVGCVSLNVGCVSHVGCGGLHVGYVVLHVENVGCQQEQLCAFFFSYPNFKLGLPSDHVSEQHGLSASPFSR